METSISQPKRYETDLIKEIKKKSINITDRFFFLKNKTKKNKKNLHNAKSLFIYIAFSVHAFEPPYYMKK